MNQYEIIVLDLDGTLTNRDKVITPKTKKALLEIQRRGKKIVLASGPVSYTHLERKNSSVDEHL